MVCIWFWDSTNYLCTFSCFRLSGFTKSDPYRHRVIYAGYNHFCFISERLVYNIQRASDIISYIFALYNTTKSFAINIRIPLLYNLAFLRLFNSLPTCSVSLIMICFLLNFPIAFPQYFIGSNGLVLYVESSPFIISRVCLNFSVLCFSTSKSSSIFVFLDDNLYKRLP